MIQLMSAKEDSIIIDYFKLTQQYQKQYGKFTVVLLQVGAFFEVYSIRNPFTGSYEITPIQAFAEHCDLNIAEKKILLGQCTEATCTQPFPILDNSPAAAKALTQWVKSMPPCPVVMAGVRDHQLDRYIQKMVEAGFTVVIYTQEKHGKDVVRGLDTVYSPGTFLSQEVDTRDRISNHITCIWLSRMGVNTALRKHATDTATRDVLVCGMASMNVFTGESHLFEYQTPLLMNPTTVDELDRHVSTVNPSEVVVVSEWPDDMTRTLIKYLSLSGQVAMHYVEMNQDTAATNCTKQTYLSQQLGALFAEDTFMTCGEFQTHIVATQAWAYLLHFVENHNTDLVRKLQFPTFTNASQRLVLANHTLQQLNMVADGNHSDRRTRLGSVTALLNQCQTPMGRRRLEYQLLHPGFDEVRLVRDYDAIEQVLTTLTPTSVTDIRRQMRDMRDLEKIARQMVSRRLSPVGIAHLYRTLMIWKTMYTEYIEDDPGFSMYISDLGTHGPIMVKLGECMNELMSMFDLEACGSNGPLFLRAERFSDVASCLARQTHALAQLETIQRQLNEAISQAGGGTSEGVRLHKTDKGGISLQVTKKRGALLKELISRNSGKVALNLGSGEYPCVPWSIIQVNKASASYDEIAFPQLKQISHDLFQIEDDLHRLMTTTYQLVLQILTDKWYPVLETVAKEIAIWDVLVTKAHIAREYRYCKPQLVPSSEDPIASFVEARGLRHALIEQLQISEIYVTNDVFMGGAETPSGILLYGTNAVGKTSLIRALGIAVILAQAGCYVPCTHFRFHPYRAIYSRILGNDNLFKGLSTFAVEMSELRMILKMADQHTLVLGDELCSGTEIDSALSIFMAGLMHLHERRASFIFATHFHEILKFQEMQDMTTEISVKHMSVLYDAQNDCLVYDRVLKDGPGNGTYGIEVAKSMHMDPIFLERAYAIRHRYFSPVQTDVLEQKPSHYNTKKLLGICEICRKTAAEEMHHLQYQRDADCDGYIGHFHKNHPANLMSLCKTCHDEWHQTRDGKKATPGTTEPAKMVRKKTTKGYRVSEDKQPSI